MARLTGSYGRPIQGVSQLPDTSKSTGQCRESINMHPDPVKGLTRRSGTINVGKILDREVHEDSFIHIYRRDEYEAYVIIVEPDTTAPLIYNLYTGVHCVVNGTVGYLRADKPSDVMMAQTIADHTLLGRRDVAVHQELGKTIPDTNLGNVLVSVRFVTYGRTYTIKANGAILAEYKAPDGEVASDADLIDTTYVAEQLIANRQIGEYSMTLINGATIVVGNVNSTPFTISTEDGAEGNDLISIQNEVESIVDLPKYAPNGFRVKVNPKGGRDENVFYLIAESDDYLTNITTTLWKETVPAGSDNSISPSTSPSTLIRESFDSTSGISTFNIGWTDWADREVGDDITNPFPPFIHLLTDPNDRQDYILDMGTFHNRLLLLTTAGMFLSRSGHFFDFFRYTSQTTRDDDPFSLYPDTDTLSYLTHHAVLNGTLIVSSESEQFALQGEGVITSGTASLNRVSAYSKNSIAGFTPLGSNLAFSEVTGTYSQVSEYYNSNDPDLKEARSITEHIPEYIKGRVVDMLVSTTSRTLLVITDDFPVSGNIYVYNWLDSGNERVQSAWHTWNFKGAERLVKAFIHSGRAYLVFLRNGETWLETMDLQDPTVQEGIDFPLHLDRVTKAYALNRGWYWELTHPYLTLPEDPETLSFIIKDGYEEDIGNEIVWSIGDGDVLTTTDSLSTSDDIVVEVYAGYLYDSVFKPAVPNPRDASGNSRDIERFQLNKLHINYVDSGAFWFNVKNTYTSKEWTYQNDMRRLGDPTNIIGFPHLLTGSYQVSVRQEAKYLDLTLTVSSHLPFSLRDMEYEAKHAIRGRRY